MTDFTRRALIDSLADEGGGLRRLELALNPAAVTSLAEGLADQALPYEPSLVLSWAGEDIVLAHAVASILRVPRVVVSLDLGLMTVFPNLPPESRVLIVATMFTNANPVASIATMLRERGHTLVLAAAIAGESGTADVPFIAPS